MGQVFIYISIARCRRYAITCAVVAYLKAGFPVVSFHQPFRRTYGTAVWLAIPIKPLWGMVAHRSLPAKDAWRYGKDHSTPYKTVGFAVRYGVDGGTKQY